MTIIPFDGACEVHERYTPDDIAIIREDYDGELTVIAHPECPSSVIEAADFAIRFIWLVILLRTSPRMSIDHRMFDGRQFDDSSPRGPFHSILSYVSTHEAYYT